METTPAVVINEIRSYDIHSGDVHANIFAEINLQTDVVTFKTRPCIVLEDARGNKQRFDFIVEVTKCNLGDRTTPSASQVKAAFDVMMSPAYQEKTNEFIEGEIRKAKLMSSVAEAKSRKIVGINDWSKN